MFSKSCKYAIRASIFVAKHSLEGNKIGFIEIAKEIGSPEAFTAKILQTLVRQKVLKSVKGVNGGFYIIKKNVNQTTLAQIVTAIDGENTYSGCGLGLADCSDAHPCPVHNQFKHIKKDLINMLENTNLEELALGIKSGDTFLKY